MTAPTTSPAALQYLAEVEAELADLPPDDRADLLEDLAMHLADLAAEPDDRTPAERLGPAGRYAAELRSAAGLPPRTARARGDRPGLRSAAAAVRASALVREARAFLPQLRPAWWVLRGYLLVAIPALRDVDGTRDFPVPAPLGSHVLGAALVALAVAGSVVIGRLKLPRPAALCVVVLNILLAVAAFALLTDARDRLTTPVFAGPVAQASLAPGQLLSAHGPVTNIYPYAADGTPLDGVLLYDQDGRPLAAGPQQWWPDGCRRVRAQPRAADGVPVPMSYPQQYVLDPSGLTQYGTPAGPGQCTALSRPAVPLPAFPTAHAPTPAATPAPNPGPKAGRSSGRTG